MPVGEEWDGKKLEREREKQFKRKALRDNEGEGEKEGDMPGDEGASEEAEGKEEEFRRAHGLYGWTLVASDQRLANSRLS